MADRTEYYSSWENFTKNTEKQEEKEAKAKKAKEQQDSFKEAMQPRGTGYEFRTGHKTQFPDCKVQSGEGEEAAAYRVALERRAAGIESFKDGTVWGAQVAVDAWGQGLLALERLKNLRKYKPLREAGTEGSEETELPDSGPSDEEVISLMVTVRLNMAQALLKLKEYQGCVAHCDKALEWEPANPKGLWRKAKAVWGIRNPGVARETLHRLLEVDAGNPAAVALLREIDQEEQKKRAKRTGVKGTAPTPVDIPTRPISRGREAEEEQEEEEEGEEDEEEGEEEDDDEDEELVAWWRCCRRREKLD